MLINYVIWNIHHEILNMKLYVGLYVIFEKKQTQIYKE